MEQITLEQLKAMPVSDKVAAEIRRLGPEMHWNMQIEQGVPPPETGRVPRRQQGCEHLLKTEDMTDIDRIKAEIQRMMDEEMAIFREDCKDGMEPSSSSAVVYTRLQMLMKRIDEMPREADGPRQLPRWRRGTPPCKGWWLTRSEHADGRVLIACEPFRDGEWPHADDGVMYMDMGELETLPMED